MYVPAIPVRKTSGSVTAGPYVVVTLPTVAVTATAEKKKKKKKQKREYGRGEELVRARASYTPQD